MSKVFVPPPASYNLQLDGLLWITSSFDKTRRVPALYRASQNKLTQFTAICCGPWSDDMNVVAKRCDLMRETVPLNMYYFDYPGFGLSQGACVRACVRVRGETNKEKTKSLLQAR